MIYIISIVPIILYQILLKGMDGFSLAKWKIIIECLVWGILSCLLCYLLGIIIDYENYFKFDDSFPIVEELIKGAPLVISVYKKRFVFFSETLIYGSAVGAGFSLLENILYISLSEEFTIGDSIIRGIGTSLLHIGCTALLTSISIVVSRISKDKNHITKIILAIISLFPSAIIHYVYNLFLINEFIQMLVTILVYICIFSITYTIDEKLIHKWLDLCITNDISLYTSIRQGKFHTTNTGKYLIMAKERFQPEVFFDICVFLGLYLEISIAAKSRMIMKEANMAIPLSKEERMANASKVNELKALKKSIGTSGIMLLKPFVDFNAADEWVINELI